MKHTELDAQILVRGANDVGSAVAHGLFQAGYAVVLHEMPQPTSTRRRMSFTDAVFDGYASLNGVDAQLVRSSDLSEALAAHKIVPAVVQDVNDLMRTLRPQIMIDARMQKQAQPETPRGLADLTIGLGPNFIAGETVDLAIETGGGDSLGQFIESGAANALQGEPRKISGHVRDRYVYAPAAGVFYTSLSIGGAVLTAIQHGEANHVH